MTKQNLYTFRRIVFLVIPTLILLFVLIYISAKNLFPEEAAETGNISATDIPALTAKPTAVPERNGKVRLVVYHTHNDEAFYKGKQKYTESVKGRTDNSEYNVMRLGKDFANSLNKSFDVTHDEANNMSNGFNYAYDTAYENEKKYCGVKDVFVDIHRDAYSGENPNYAQKNSSEYALIKFVVANGSNFDKNPDWQKNKEYADKITKELNKLVPGVASEPVFKDYRFNQHLGEVCLLAEIGNEKNTLTQARNSAKLLAEAFNNAASDGWWK